MKRIKMIEDVMDGKTLLLKKDQIVYIEDGRPMYLGRNNKYRVMYDNIQLYERSYIDHPPLQENFYKMMDDDSLRLCRVFKGNESLYYLSCKYKNQPCCNICSQFTIEESFEGVVNIHTCGLIYDNIKEWGKNENTN